MFGNPIPINSSNITYAKYDPESRILELGFKTNSHVYHFFGIDEETYNQFMNADSKGSFLRNYIQHRYNYKKIK